MSGMMVGLIAGMFFGLAMACAWLYLEAEEKVAAEPVWIDEAIERAFAAIDEKMRHP